MADGAEDEDEFVEMQDCDEALSTAEELGQSTLQQEQRSAALANMTHPLEAKQELEIVSRAQ